MVKIKTWFKKHIKYEVFSFVGFLFSIGVFLYNITTNYFVPLQYSTLDAETIPYVDPAVLYVPFAAFSLIILCMAFVFLYFAVRKKKR